MAFVYSRYGLKTVFLELGETMKKWQWGLVHTSRFSTGRQAPIIAGQSSATQESIDVFTRPGRLPGREFAGRLPGSTWSYPLCPVAELTVVHVYINISTVNHSL
jgi:hypothetical protein